MRESPAVYRFGGFEVDTREQSLTRGGTLIAITPKVFDTLVMFLRHSRRLLTKEDLLDSIWPDTAVDAANLAVNVSTLRRLLDVPGQPSCIETVPRRGYRFVLPVEVAQSGAEPLTAAHRDRPATTRAQELYARANQAAYEADHWETARDLYQACVDEDPAFAPAWAQLARCHHLIAKFTAAPALREFARAQAEATFDHALAIDPSLALTHRLYAQLDVDFGRAAKAAVRLVTLVQRNGPDAATFAGLVHTLRFCGLLAQSRTAHARARALNPTIVTSVSHTYWLLGQYELALEETAGDIGYLPGLALVSLGREHEAIATLRSRERTTRDNRARAFLTSLRALLEGDRAESLHAIHRAAAGFSDPEGRYYLARMLARLSERDAALAFLRGAVGGGYFCYPALTGDPWLESVAALPEFEEVLQSARARHQSACEAFNLAGGHAVLETGET